MFGPRLIAADSACEALLEVLKGSIWAPVTEDAPPAVVPMLLVGLPCLLLFALVCGEVGFEDGGE